MCHHQDVPLCQIHYEAFVYFQLVVPPAPREVFINTMTINFIAFNTGKFHQKCYKEERKKTVVQDSTFPLTRKCHSSGVYPFIAKDSSGNVLPCFRGYHKAWEALLSFAFQVIYYDFYEILHVMRNIKVEKDF